MLAGLRYIHSSSVIHRDLVSSKIEKELVGRFTMAVVGGGYGGDSGRVKAKRNATIVFDFAIARTIRSEWVVEPTLTTTSHSFHFIFVSFLLVHTNSLLCRSSPSSVFNKSQKPANILLNEDCSLKVKFEYPEVFPLLLSVR